MLETARNITAVNEGNYQDVQRITQEIRRQLQDPTVSAEQKNQLSSENYRINRLAQEYYSRVDAANAAPIHPEVCANNASVTTEEGASEEVSDEYAPASGQVSSYLNKKHRHTPKTHKNLTAMILTTAITKYRAVSRVN